jgi:DNA-binding transcriptional regulator YiaG
VTALLERVRARRRTPAPAVAKAIRAAAGVSQQELANELGVHRVTVARWEDGTRRPGGAVLEQYVQLLDQLRDAVGAA